MAGGWLLLAWRVKHDTTSMLVFLRYGGDRWMWLACRRPKTILLSSRPMHADPTPLFPDVCGHLMYWMRVEEDEEKPVETEEPAVPEPGT